MSGKIDTKQMEWEMKYDTDSKEGWEGEKGHRRGDISTYTQCNAAGKEGVGICCFWAPTRCLSLGFCLDLVYQLFHDFHADELLLLYDSGTGSGWIREFVIISLGTGTRGNKKLYLVLFTFFHFSPVVSQNTPPSTDTYDTVCTVALPAPLRPAV